MRQHGNLSFIRTYGAGHAIPAYQPETAYRVFTRALFNLDIATGRVSTAGNYTSEGRADPNVQREAGVQGLTYCYTYALGECYEWQQEAVLNGTAEVCSWLFVDQNSTRLFPEVVAKCRAEGSGGNQTGGALPEFEGEAAGRVGVGLGAVVLGVLALVVV